MNFERVPHTYTFNYISMRVFTEHPLKWDWITSTHQRKKISIGLPNNGSTTHTTTTKTKKKTKTESIRKFMFIVWASLLHRYVCVCVFVCARILCSIKNSEEPIAQNDAITHASIYSSIKIIREKNTRSHIVEYKRKASNEQMLFKTNCKIWQSVFSCMKNDFGGILCNAETKW